MPEVDRKDIAVILGSVIGNTQVSAGLTNESRLIGTIVELDSFAIVNLMTALEDHYGFVWLDDEVDETIFETFGSLSGFVEQKAQNIGQR